MRGKKVRKENREEKKGNRKERGKVRTEEQ